MSDFYDQEKDGSVEGHATVSSVKQGFTIHKFEINMLGGPTEIALPAMCKALDVQTDEKTGLPAIWIELNPEHDKVKRLVLQVAVTGGQVPFGDWFGSFQMKDPSNNSNFVGHVYGHWA